MLKKSQTEESPHGHSKKSHHIYKIYEAQPPTNFEGLYTELPPGLLIKVFKYNFITVLNLNEFF